MPQEKTELLLRLNDWPGSLGLLCLITQKNENMGGFFLPMLECVPEKSVFHLGTRISTIENSVARTPLATSSTQSR